MAASYMQRDPETTLKTASTLGTITLFFLILTGTMLHMKKRYSLESIHLWTFLVQVLIALRLNIAVSEFISAVEAAHSVQKQRRIPTPDSISIECHSVLSCCAKLMTSTTMSFSLNVIL